MNLRSKGNILIIDDEESIRTTIQVKLLELGYSVTLGATGAHGIQILKTGKRFDLIICDLKMPLKSGLEVIEFLSVSRPNVPTILLTGFAEESNVAYAKSLGIDTILIKPFRMPNLLAAISSKIASRGV